jgi:hypothetical protein
MPMTDNTKRKRTAVFGFFKEDRKRIKQHALNTDRKMVDVLDEMVAQYFKGKSL